MPRKINLGIVFGGKSDEHEVSLSSARGVIDALDKEKYNIIPIAITKKGNWLIGDRGSQYLKLSDGSSKEGGISVSQSQKLVSVSDKNLSLTNIIEGETGNSRIDLVLPIIHGPYAEDGKLQGMLEMLGVPYMFSDVLGSALAMNKPRAKVIVRDVGVDVIPYRVLKKGGDYNLPQLIKEFSWPMVVKPVELGSSVGISIVDNRKELKKSIDKAFQYGPEIMIEEFKKGRELTVGVMGNNPSRPLPVIEIIPKLAGFYDYKSKYQDGGSEHVCPAKIPQKIKKRVQDSAVKAFQALGCRDLARADFIWSEEDNKVYFLEVNTIPGMTMTSLYPETAKAAGMGFGQFLDTLIKERLRE